MEKRRKRRNGGRLWGLKSWGDENGKEEEGEVYVEKQVVGEGNPQQRTRQVAVHINVCPDDKKCGGIKLFFFIAK